MGKRAVRVARNSLFLFASQAYSSLIILLYIPPLTRYLGQEGYGRYNYAYAFVGLFQVLAFLGLHAILVREVSRDKEKASLYLGNVLVIKLLLSTLTLGLIALGVGLRAPSPEDRLIIYLSAAEMLLRIYGNANISVFRAFQRMEYELLVDILDGTVALVGVLLVIYFRLGLVAIFIAFLLAAVVRTLSNFAINVFKFVRPRFEMRRAVWKRVLWESTPIGVSQGLQRIYERQGTVLLERMRGSAEVGLLGAPLRIYQLMDIGVRSVVEALFPIFSSLAVSTQEALAETYQAALKFLLILSLPLAGLLWVLAEVITLTLLGPDFSASATVLRILAPAVVFSFLGFLFSLLLRAIDRQKGDTLNWILALALNLGLSFILINAYGFLGAGLALLISEGIFCLLGFFLVSHYLTPIPINETVLKPLACGVAAGGVLFLLHGFSLPISLLAAGATYAGTLFLFDVFNPKEKKFLQGLFLSFTGRLGWRKP